MVELFLQGLPRVVELFFSPTRVAKTDSSVSSPTQTLAQTMNCTYIMLICLGPPSLDVALGFILH